MKNGTKLLIALLILFSPACALTGPAADPEIEPTDVVIEVTLTEEATLDGTVRLWGAPSD